MPSMLVPNQDQLVTMLPKTAMTIRPRSRIMPPQRAWRMMAFQRTMISAPFPWGPIPRSGPGLVRPDAAEDGADEAGEGGETDHPVDHAAQRDGGGFRNAAEGAADQIDHADGACEEGR
jgi:hypothetical protein